MALLVVPDGGRGAVGIGSRFPAPALSEQVPRVLSHRPANGLREGPLASSRTLRCSGSGGKRGGYSFGAADLSGIAALRAISISTPSSTSSAGMSTDQLTR